MTASKSALSRASSRDEKRASMRDSYDKGFSIEDSARVLFDGLQNDTLYIGPKAFHRQISEQTDFGELDEIIRNRAENIINERNPERPV